MLPKVEGAWGPVKAVKCDVRAQGPSPHLIRGGARPAPESEANWVGSSGQVPLCTLAQWLCCF
jgi:hypothetical protein